MIHCKQKWLTRQSILLCHHYFWLAPKLFFQNSLSFVFTSRMNFLPSSLCKNIVCVSQLFLDRTTQNDLVWRNYLFKVSWRVVFQERKSLAITFSETTWTTHKYTSSFCQTSEPTTRGNLITLKKKATTMRFKCSFIFWWVHSRFISCFFNETFALRGSVFMF